MTAEGQSGCCGSRDWLSLRGLQRLLVLFLLLVLLGFGYSWLKARIAAAVYRDRLLALRVEYDALRDRYNAAVRRTAVTELEVAGGRLAVCVRTVDGVLKRFETPYDPANEIYVDYIVADGRLWIRRVFDSRTPPEAGVVIDPRLASIDWTDERQSYGKAVYRQLGDGRWIITVTGDGSLGLTQIPADQAVPPLTAAPPVKDYDQIEADGRPDPTEIGILDVLRLLMP